MITVKIFGPAGEGKSRLAQAILSLEHYKDRMVDMVQLEGINNKKKIQDIIKTASRRKPYNKRSADTLIIISQREI
jgi:replication-associated recombination protein RarA